MISGRFRVIEITGDGTRTEAHATKSLGQERGNVAAMSRLQVPGFVPAYMERRWILRLGQGNPDRSCQTSVVLRRNYRSVPELDALL
jgi:hypothetical protein